VLTALSIKNQIAPPTINLENQDPECDLDYVPNIARNMKSMWLCPIPLVLAARTVR